MSLRQQLVRDLEWMVHSPPLLSHPLAVLPDSGQLSDDQINAEELESFINERKSRRVGHYFENLVYFWLRNIRKLEIVESGFQIQEGGKTLGEIDFLFRDENGELNHWEIAVKFYLYFPLENHTGSHFIGPNAKDTLERKTKRLFEHQLLLSEGYFPDVAKRTAFVKGRIFYHPNQTRVLDLPPILSSSHLKGKWIRSSQLDYFNGLPNHARFQILKKPFWLTSQIDRASEVDYTESQLQETIEEHFETSEAPLLVSFHEERSDRFQETDHIFIVGERWLKASE